MPKSLSGVYSVQNQLLVGWTVPQAHHLEPTELPCIINKQGIRLAAVPLPPPAQRQGDLHVYCCRMETPFHMNVTAAAWYGEHSLNIVRADQDQ